MKNYLLVSIAMLCALTVGFLFGRYSSADNGRYFFHYNGDNSSLFDTKTGDLYEVDNKGVYIINYRESFNKHNNK